MTIEVLVLPAGMALWIAPDLEYALISSRLSPTSRAHVTQCLEEFDRLRKGFGAEGQGPSVTQQSCLVGRYPE